MRFLRKVIKDIDLDQKNRELLKLGSYPQNRANLLNIFKSNKVVRLITFRFPKPLKSSDITILGLELCKTFLNPERG